MNGAAWISIIRPVNALVAGFAGVLATIIATGAIPAGFWFVFLIILLITAAGNVINDFFDAEIDAINQPDRAIPSGQITKNGALVYAILLFISGNTLALLFAPLPLTIIAVFNSFLLCLYAARLKTAPLLGNIAVSYLASSIFLFGGAITGVEGIIATLPIAGATLGVMLARELVKDAEDMPGDAACGAKTFPVLYGIRPTLSLAIVSAGAGVLVSLALVSRWGVPYLIAIILVDLIILYGAAKGITSMSADEVIRSKSSKYLKAGMFASLLVFLASAVLL